MPIKGVDKLNTARAEENDPKPITIVTGVTIKPVDRMNQEGCRHLNLGARASYVQGVEARWCLNCHRWIW